MKDRKSECVDGLWFAGKFLALKGNSIQLTHKVRLLGNKLLKIQVPHGIEEVLCHSMIRRDPNDLKPKRGGFDDGVIGCGIKIENELGLRSQKSLYGRASELSNEAQKVIVGNGFEIDAVVADKANEWFIEDDGLGLFEVASAGFGSGSY